MVELSSSLPGSPPLCITVRLAFLSVDVALAKHTNLSNLSVAMMQKLNKLYTIINDYPYDYLRLIPTSSNSVGILGDNSSTSPLSHVGNVCTCNEKPLERSSHGDLTSPHRASVGAGRLNDGRLRVPANPPGRLLMRHQ